MASEHGVVCILWRDYNGEVPSVRKNCSACNAEVAVDEQNIPRILAEGIVILCVPCAIPVLADNPQTDFVGLVGGQTVKGFKDASMAAIARIQRRRG